MSRFYASIQGSRGEAARCGHRDIVSHVRGWNSGVNVFGWRESDDEADYDAFRIELTGGSGHGEGLGCLAVLKGDTFQLSSKWELSEGGVLTATPSLERHNV